VALSEDQKAMLRLLAQREQGYGDIAALLGLSIEEVRAKAKAAAAQMEAEGLPAPALPPDLDGAEQAEEPTAEPPSAPAPTEPREPEGPAPLPPPPLPPPRRESVTSARPRLTMPSDPGVRGALVAAALVVVALVVVLIVSSGGGDSSGEATTTSSNTVSEGASSGEDAAVANSQEITKAVLEAVDGSEASGVAIFGREGKSLALQVEATGLEPPGKGESYAIWLAQSPQRMLPLAAAPVSKSGRLASQFRVPVEVLGYLANETFTQMAITLVDDSALDAALKEATKAKESPDYTGTAVLRGEVTGPIVGAAK
jgi:hypothetical protein